MLNPITFKSNKSGPRFLVLGAVHGNEKCGTEAIQKVIDEIKNKQLTIESGSVTFVPICNPNAFERDVRFIERNLNRYLLPEDPPSSYEAALGNELCPIISQCDVLLDIHSYTVGGEPFACVDGGNLNENKFALALGAYALVGDWEKAYSLSGHYETNPNESIGTTAYARRFKAIAVTLECGQHKNPASTKIAYEAIHNGLTYLGMTNNPRQLPTRTPLELNLISVIYRSDDGELAEDWKNFSFVKKNQLCATRKDGTRIIAPSDGYIVMPKFDCPIGAEWFYLGTMKQ